MNVRIRTAAVGARVKWLRAAAGTHPGKKRTANEDAFLLHRLPAHAGLIVAVADGMGGHGGGALAAELALRALAEPPEVRWADGTPAELHERLLERFYAADEAIRERGKLELGRGAMGTTIAAAVVRSGGALHLYAGDSRIYQFRAGQCIHRTRDHSVLQVLADLGQTPAGPALAALRGQLTSCLGGSASGSRFVADPRAEAGVDPPPSWRALEPGDVLLLVSDGVSNELGEDRMCALVAAHAGSPKHLVQAVLAEVLEGAAADNLTALAVAFVRPRPPAGRRGPLS